jgi:hypothetical protein
MIMEAELLVFEAFPLDILKALPFACTTSR